MTVLAASPPNLTRDGAVDMSDLLTETEHEAMDLTAELMRAMRQIMGDANIAGDLNEAAAHIHGIQNMILANAAARAYPDRYRLLGQQGPWARDAETTS